MPIGSNEAADLARAAVATERGHALHLEFDRLSNEILRSLGYGEFVDLFEQAIADGHGATLARLTTHPTKETR